jgi:hypothetical protein
MVGHLSSTDSCDFREFFGRRDPRLPALPALPLEGKEGVDGSSPSEGLTILQIERFCCLIRRSPDHGQLEEFAGVSG